MKQKEFVKLWNKSSWTVKRVKVFGVNIYADAYVTLSDSVELSMNGGRIAIINYDLIEEVD